MGWFLFENDAEEREPDARKSPDVSPDPHKKHGFSGSELDAFLANAAEEEPLPAPNLFRDAGNLSTLGYMTVPKKVEDKWNNSPKGAFKTALEKFMEERKIGSNSALAELFDVSRPTVYAWLDPKDPKTPDKKTLLGALIRSSCTYGEAEDLLHAAGYHFSAEKTDQIILYYFMYKATNGWDQIDLYETLKQQRCKTDFWHD